MYIKHFLLLFVLVFTFSSLSAQKKKKRKKDRDIEIIEFGDDDDDDSFSNSELSGYIIKTSPVSYLVGSQFVEVEKYVTDYLSLQAGLGVTFNPLIGNTYDNVLSNLEDDGAEFCDSDQWASDICDDYQDYDIRSFKPGFMISGSARLFFDDDAMDGSYFGVKLRYSTRNIDVQDVVQNATSVMRLDDITQSEKLKRFDLVGHYGYQTLYSKLTAEYFVGLGVRFSNDSRQDLGRDALDRVNSGMWQYKSTDLRIEGGIRIGFQL